MIVVEKYNDNLHNPSWVFHLGPESYETRDTPQRVQAIKERLRKDERIRFVKAHRYPERLIARIHPYHDFIKNVCKMIKDPQEEIYPDLFPGEGANLPKRLDQPLWGGLWCMDSVTPLKKRTYEVARASAETALTAADLILKKRDTTVYALCRPAGHHAGPREFGGYCYFNNVATAAEYLASEGSIAILDTDYHHGNGTQEFFQGRKYVFTASIHADPSVEYPYFWGYTDEVGKGQGKGYNLNIPLPRGTGIEKYLKAVDRVVDSFRQFKPDFLIIAAGFDIHETDPIGEFRLQTEDFRAIGERLASLDVPTIICQEGGYSLDILGECVYQFLDPFGL